MLFEPLTEAIFAALYIKRRTVCVSFGFNIDGHATLYSAAYQHNQLTVNKIESHMFVRVLGILSRVGFRLKEKKVGNQFILDGMDCKCSRDWI